MAQFGDITTIIDVPLAIGMFNSGKSVNAIANHFGCSRNVIGLRFKNAGVAVRNRSEGMYARMAETPFDKRQELAIGANKAMRSRSHEWHMRRLTQAATCKEATLCKVGILEQSVADRLAKFKPIMQKAVGTYNIDIAAGAVAVEIHNSTVHPHIRADYRNRIIHLLKCGYTVVYVKIARHIVINEIAINKLIEVCKYSGSNESLRGKYWVIRGTGEGLAIGTLNGNDLSIIETSESLFDYFGIDRS